MSSTSNTTFYQKLVSFNDFKGITNDQNFHAVPNNWLVIITDIVSSTKAIEKGQYKDVNTIGVASIVSAHNAMGYISFPYVFGGDGSTLLIPNKFRAAIEKELIALKEVAKRGFELYLRISIISVADLLSENVTIEVAKFELSGEKSVAIFRGGGLSLADKMIKAQRQKYEIKGRVKHMVDLKNLSCRWNAIPAKRGKNLSLLVMLKNNHDMVVILDILTVLEALYDGNLDAANPVDVEKMSYKGFF